MADIDTSDQNAPTFTDAKSRALRNDRDWAIKLAADQLRLAMELDNCGCSRSCKCDTEAAGARSRSARWKRIADAISDLLILRAAPRAALTETLADMIRAPSSYSSEELSDALSALFVPGTTETWEAHAKGLAEYIAAYREERDDTLMDAVEAQARLEGERDALRADRLKAAQPSLAGAAGRHEGADAMKTRHYWTVELAPLIVPGFNPLWQPVYLYRWRIFAEWKAQRMRRYPGLVRVGEVVK
jgi:hypothetical protein